MPWASVNASAPVRLFYQVHLPSNTALGEERGRCLLCTGFQTEGYTWEKQLDALLDRGYACVTFDNRGCGRSGQPPYRYTTSMLARDAMELLCVELAWKPQEVHLVGVSMGGMYALEMMAGLREGAYADILAPDGGAAFLSAALLVTMAAGWRGGLEGTVPSGFFRIMASAALVPGRSARAKIFRSMEQAFSKEWLRADSGVKHPKTGMAMTNAQVLTRRGAREYYAKVAEGVPPMSGWGAYVGQVLAVLTHSVGGARLQLLSQHLAGTCPVLVVCAGEDRMVRYAAQRRVAASLRPAVVEVLDMPDSSHGVTEERREDVNAALCRLMETAEEWRTLRAEGRKVSLPAVPHRSGLTSVPLHSRL